jgi:hypothetical protein
MEYAWPMGFTHPALCRSLNLLINCPLAWI